MDQKLIQEWTEVECRIFCLLDELDAVEVLRAHVPAGHQHLVDRLDWSLRLRHLLETELHGPFALEYAAEGLDVDCPF